MYAIKSKDTDGKQTTESVAELRAAVEDRGTEGKLLLVVEEREEVEGTREEDGLNGTDENTSNQEASKVVNRSHDGGNGTPDSHAAADV